MSIECEVDGCERPRYGAKPHCEMHYRRVLRTGRVGPPGPIVRERGVCEEEGCQEPHDALGLCHGHYQRLDRQGEVGSRPLRGSLNSCRVEGCDRQIQGRELCGTHYARFYKYGDPMVDTPIKEVAGNGYVHKGYRQIPVHPSQRHLTNGKASSAEHRFVMAKHLGRPLRGDENVHHINGDRLDNRLENLELWSTSQPSGKRVEDLLEYAQVILDRYEDEFGYVSESSES